MSGWRDYLADPEAGPVLQATLLLSCGYGVSAAVTPLYLEGLGLGDRALGALGSAYGLGLLLSALPLGRLVRELGPRRTLLAGLLAYVGYALALPRLASPGALALARFGDGVSSLAIWLGAETVLLARARGDAAGLLGAYGAAGAAGYLIGPLLARALLGRVELGAMYLLPAGFALLAAARVALCPGLGRGAVPEAGHARSLGALWGLARRLRTACAGGFAYGYFHATALLFLPIHFLREGALGPELALLVPGLYVLGAALGSSPVGRAADRAGHLPALRRLAGAGALLSLAFTLARSPGPVGLAVFCSGYVLAPVQAVCLALQASLAGPAEAGHSNALFGAAYALGRLTGPLASGLALQARGGAAMLLLLAAAWAAAALLAARWAADAPLSRTP